MQIEQKKIKKVLVVRNDRFGEFLLNIPALRALKKTFTDARVIAVVDPYVKELAGCVPFIDETIEWNALRHNLSERLGLIRLLRRKAIDIAIMLNPSKELNFITFMSGIPVRVGYDRKCAFFLTHKMQDTKSQGQRHEIDYNLELVGLIGAKTDDWGLSLTIDSKEAFGKFLQGSNIKDTNTLIAIHPWTSDSIKQWPQNRFCELAKRLLNDSNVRIMVVGGREELFRSKELFENFDQRLINATGRTSLKQLAGLLKKCRLLISGDSGPVHLACAVGTPVIAIFRCDSPGKSARRWGPRFKGSFVLEKKSLSDIGVDEVLDRVREALKISR